MSRRDVLKTGGMVSFAPVSGVGWTDGASTAVLAGAGGARHALGSAGDVVFFDDFTSNTLDEYEISQGGSRAGAGTVTWDSTGEQVRIRTGNNVAVLLSRDDVPFPQSGSVRLRYVVHSDYHLTNDFAVRWEADGGDLLEWQVSGDAPDSSRFRDSYDDWVMVRRDGESEVLDRTDGSVGPNSGERVEASWTPSSMAVAVDGAVEASGDVDTTAVAPSTLTLSFSQGDVDLQSIVVSGSGGGGELVWETAADWDSAVSESGVVHESVANTDQVDAGVVKRGYSVSQPRFADGLVGYWPLQEDSGGIAYDFSGNGNDGTVHGAAQGQAGLLGTTCYSFDGVDDWVLISDANDGNKPLGADGASAFTITAWINVDSTDSVRTIYGRNYQGTGTVGPLFRADENERLHLYDNSSTHVANTQMATKTWNFVGVVVVDGASLEFYLNGSPDGTASPSNLPWDGSQDAGIGVADERGGSLMAGRISEVRVYDRALSPGEIQALYDVVATSGTITTGSKEAN